MDNPLSRRMFRQPVRANQPMGILASSPQLMGAVQGYANGGAVKGYEAGGLEASRSLANKFNERGFSLLAVPSILKQHPNITYSKDLKQFVPKTDKNDLPAESNTTTTLDLEALKNKNLVEKEGEFGTKKEAPEATATDDFSGDTSATFDRAGGGDESGRPKVSEKSMIQEPGAVINNENKSILQTDKELKDNIPEGKNLGVKTGKDIVAESTKDYESWKTKFQKIEQDDKKFEVSQEKVKDFTSKIETLMNKTDKPLSLDDAYKQAEKQLGVKEGRYNEDKMTAFWMAMIAGGAETAAGQSSNAFTNFAKGLKFGVQQFGKDLNAINEDEREDRKNIAKLSYELVKDDKSAKLAERTLKIQGYQALANLEEKKFQFRSEMEYKKESDKIKNEMARASLQLTAAKTFNDMALGKGNYDLRVETLALNKQKQKDYLVNFQKELNQKFQLGTMTDEVKNVLAFGEDFGSFDDKGKYTLNDKGRKIVLASVLGKTKITDTIKTAQAFGKNKIVYGSEYATADAAESAYLVFKGEYEPRIKVLEKLSENSLKKIDREKYKKEVDSLKQEFFNATGAVRRVDGSSTGTINQNSITLPSNLIEQLKDVKIGTGTFQTKDGKKYRRTGENTAVPLE